MLQVLEVLRTSLMNLVRSLCVMVYSSRPALTNHTKKSPNTSTRASLAQGLRKSGRLREWKKRHNRTCDDGFDTYFQNVFDNTQYEEKDENEIKFNQAKIPKIHHQARNQRVPKKESKVTMNEIKVQLQQKGKRNLRRSRSQILGVEKRNRIPKVILRRAKKHKQELNPELLLTENARPLRLTRSAVCLSTRSRTAREKKNITSSLKAGARITRSSGKRNSEGLEDILRTRSGRVVKKRLKLCL